jgi:hypothetical protein
VGTDLASILYAVAVEAQDLEALGEFVLEEPVIDAAVPILAFMSKAAPVNMVDGQE